MARPNSISASFARIRQEQRQLYDWMRDHHDAFAAELDALSPRNRWTRTLGVIAGLKLVDSHGNAVTRDTAIRTWKRVRDDVAAARSKRQGAPPPALAPGEIAPGVHAAPGRITAPTPVWGAPNPSTVAGHAPAQPDPMRRLHEQMNAGKVPMPKTLG